MDNGRKNGYGIIEILIASTISVILFLSVNSFLNLSLKIAIDDMHKAEALNLARATLEGARAIRDEDKPSPDPDPKLGWNEISGLTFDAPHHIEASGVGPYDWTPISGSQAVGRYTVWFTVSEVQRANFGIGDIVSGGGIVDPQTIKVTSNVTWTSSKGLEQISLYEYLTNIK